MEREFGIEIPDRVAEQIQTVGGMHDHVYAALCERDGPENVIEAAVWSKLVHVIVDEVGVGKSEVRRHALFVKDLRMD